MQVSAEKIRVGELFAGVGGFRVGLEGLGTKTHPGAGGFEVVFSNQWEPKEKSQIASKIYAERFGGAGHSNEDIFNIVRDPKKFQEALDLKLDMLVGGFPCQDYSVARLAHQAGGLSGEKGVLWWAIYDFLRLSLDAGQVVKYVLLENVDNLIRAGRGCKGRDFAIILSCLAKLGYTVEWRVVHSADHGWPQQRRRTFILAYHQSTALGQKIIGADLQAWLKTDGTFATQYPGDFADKAVSVFSLEADPIQVQATYSPSSAGKSAFLSSGVFARGMVVTASVKAVKSLSVEAQRAGVHTLGDVIAKTQDVADSFYIAEERLALWEKAKSGRKVDRVTVDGHKWTYSEGAMAFPDSLTRASRTIICSEGGATPLRTKHAVMDQTGRLRRLTSEELEELSGFPRGWTDAAGATENQRGKLIGNSLVCGVVEQIGRTLRQKIVSADIEAK